MEGYDVKAAPMRIAKALRRAGAREPEDELRAFIKRAMVAHEDYMRDAGVIDERGAWLDADMYDEDDACEAVLAALEEGADEETMPALLMKLDAFMECEVAYLEEIGLL